MKPPCLFLRHDAPELRRKSPEPHLLDAFLATAAFHSPHAKTQHIPVANCSERLKMATAMRTVTPQARLGAKVSIQAPSQAKAFGLGIPRTRRAANQFKALAYKITLKTPNGDEEIECDGECGLLCNWIFWGLASCVASTTCSLRCRRHSFFLERFAPLLSAHGRVDKST